MASVVANIAICDLLFSVLVWETSRRHSSYMVSFRSNVDKVTAQ